MLFDEVFIHIRQKKKKKEKKVFHFLVHIGGYEAHKIKRSEVKHKCF